ncbi:MAG: hypothetical protein ABW004_01520 [Aeromicrobium sp.]
MGAERRIGRRTVSTLVVLVLQLAACLLLLVVPFDGGPHHAPVTISAPSVVASSLADQVNARAGHPLDAGVAETAADARGDVESGRVVAALAIDLRLNRATLFVSSAQGDALTDAVSADIRSMAEPFAVTVTSEDVAPVPDGSAGQTGLRLVVAGSVLLGLAIAIVITWRRGPVADRWAHAGLRILITVGVAGVVSLAVAAVAAHRVGGSLVGWWSVLVLTVLATTAATLARAGVLGVPGFVVATLVFVLTAAPLARVEHPLLLPPLWGAVTPWLPHGACLDAARQVAWFDGTGTLGPVVVLVAWIAVSCVVLAAARRERRRAGVDWRRGATAR